METWEYKLKKPWKFWRRRRAFYNSNNYQNFKYASANNSTSRHLSTAILASVPSGVRRSLQ